MTSKIESRWRLASSGLRKTKASRACRQKSLSSSSPSPAAFQCSTMSGTALSRYRPKRHPAARLASMCDSSDETRLDRKTMAAFSRWQKMCLKLHACHIALLLTRLHPTPAPVRVLYLMCCQGPAASSRCPMTHRQEGHLRDMAQDNLHIHMHESERCQQPDRVAAKA